MEIIDKVIHNSIHLPLALTFENSSQSSIIHLIRAVKHNNIFSKRFAHVFSGLCKIKENDFFFLHIFTQCNAFFRFCSTLSLGHKLVNVWSTS